MGFNTVAFLLNDNMSRLEKSPKTVAWILAHPPMGQSDIESCRAQADSVADEHGEPRVFEQVLEVLPTFHADYTSYFMAGGNCIVRLKEVRRGRTKDGKPTITLELPEWADPKKRRR